MDTHATTTAAAAGSSASGGAAASSSNPATSALMSSSAAPPSFQPARVDLDSYAAHLSIGDWATTWPNTIRTLAKGAAKYVLLTDSNIDRLYGKTLLANLKAIGLDVIYLVLPPGEQTKCRETKAMIEDWMFSHNCGRDSVILAFGGGVMGDLCGYVASGYMRGIPFIQLPTSFLAMVDSSIGGKTGIDTPAGKNLLGAFHRPLAVLIDLSLLLTLPQRELCNGMAESIKAGLIASRELFELMESNVDGLLKHKDLSLLAEVVRRSVAIKARVVLEDEHEAGLRSILNFGHSIGHAVEALSQPYLLHGECVAIGMMEEIILARSYGLVDSGVLRRVDQVLKAFSLPTKVPAHLSPRALLDKMSIDKKNKNGKKELVMLTGLGSVKSKPAYTTMIPDADLELLLSPAIGVQATPTPLRGEISVPGSKSLSNRVLLLAAMGRGPCTIRGLLHSQDTQVMLDSLSQLGIVYRWEEGLKLLVIEGCGGKIKVPSRPLFLNNAGTASRFLTSVACLVPAEGEVVLTGNARMQERPIRDLVTALREGCGASIEYMAGGKEGCFPLKITGSAQGLRGGEVKLAANISSQFVSSILLSAPHASGQDVVLTLDTSAGKQVVSKPFIDMTIKLMRQFNIAVEAEEGGAEEAGGVHRYTVKRGVYDNPPEVQVEGDASSATYPLALAAVSGGTVTVTNVGSDSLQGDAKFCEVLRSMGCRVSQTALTTTVTGPDASKGEYLTALSPIDMDALTDTFMTLAAVAVFARGTTRITNVANQRVKECNRLEVMVQELTKIGVRAKESETGIDIEGVGGTDDASLAPLRAHIASTCSGDLGGSVVIRCHDDHRIAMSLSLVGVRVGGLILDEKRCVDKTYPEYWEDCQRVFGMRFFAPDEKVMEAYERGHAGAAAAGAASANAASASVDPSQAPSIVLIGMRGSAKTTLGGSLARHLRRRLVDLDSVLESALGQSLKEFVEVKGWEEFRARELDTLTQALARDSKGCVIVCGGGVVETPAAVAALKKYAASGPVVQLRRHIDDVVAYLDADKSRPGFDAREAWARREPLFEQASSFEFFIDRADLQWGRIEQDFFAFMNSSALRRTRPSRPQSNTFFLSLTLPHLPVSSSEERARLAAQMSTLSEGVDALEVRVDLLAAATSPPNFVMGEQIKQYVAALRSVSRLPIIWTVRSRRQGGAFPDYEGEGVAPEDAAANEKKMLAALELGMRLGCETIDVESAMSHAAREKIYALRDRVYPGVQIISSHHVTSSGGGSSVAEVKQLFTQCAQASPTAFGAAARGPEVLKVVVMAKSEQDSFRLMQAAAEVEREYAGSAASAPALIALAMGPLGRITRVYNRVLTPVTHPGLPIAAAPGQLSVKEIMRARETLSLSPFDAVPASPSGKRHWLLFGSPITHSPSPLLHNTAFAWLGVSSVFDYSKLETSSIQAVEQAIARSDFGGGNVTIPLKELVAPLLNSTSEAVKRIGAVNTIVRLADGSLHGENTDWQGIQDVVASRLMRAVPAASDVAIVLGAGGTARAAIYALQQMRFPNSRIVLFNPRTREHAAKLAAEFGVQAVTNPLTRLAVAQKVGLETFTVSVIVSTVPGLANVRLEDANLIRGQHEKPVLLDASYVPSETALITQLTREHGVPESQVARGLDMLISQGIFGCELWMGKKLPQPCRQAMEDAVRKAYKEQHAAQQI